jgi:hypothetical protein
MKIFNYQRPSTLPAACAQVPGVPGPLAEAAAHALAVGHPAVRGASVIAARHQQQVKGRIASTFGALTVQGSAMVAVNRNLGDVRGVPPRGRPV